MSAGEFVDANVVLYAHDVTARDKRDLAASLLARLQVEGTGCVSAQVLMEFFVIATRRLTVPLATSDAAEIVAGFSTWRFFSPILDDVVAAIRIAERHRIHFWDAMIVRAAAELGAKVLWSEDLADGAAYEGVTVRDPFRASRT